MLHVLLNMRILSHEIEEQNKLVMLTPTYDHSKVKEVIPINMGIIHFDLVIPISRFYGFHFLGIWCYQY